MKKLILASAIIISTSSTMAMENSFYFKSTYGMVNTDISSQETQEKLSTDLSDPNGWSFILGYHLNKFLALEGGYVDLGDAEGRYHDRYDSPYGFSAHDTIHNYTINTQAKTFGLFLTTDITKDFFAGLRVGYQFWNEHFEDKVTKYLHYYDHDQNGVFTDIATRSYTEKDQDCEIKDGSDLYYGVSAGWNYNNWSVSLEHTIFEMEERKPSLTSLGLTYNF
ncbi:hypothetical protein [Microbulbifer sp. JMSA008]|uniref:hypothetical protein n=1 Tax=Microbulbifer sp. JMSA008 TaxID=3243373 RepID=UPI0040397A60